MQLYHIFYNECKPVSIDILHSFSFSPENIQKVKKEIVIEETEIKNDFLQKIDNQCVKATHVQDGLFWSIYIAVYGYHEYLRNKYNYGKLEVREKQKIADFVLTRGNNHLNTNYKVTRSFCGEIVADLISLPRMVFSGLIGMCAFYKKDIYIVDIIKHTYISFLGSEGNGETIILYRNPLHTRKFSSNEYFIDIGLTIQSLEEIREKYFAIEHYAKPLKGISAYLKTDLENIAEKTVFTSFNIEDMQTGKALSGGVLNEKKCKEKKIEVLSKQELYNSILMYLSNDDSMKN